MLVLSLKTEPTGDSSRQMGGLQSPYNGIAFLEFQDLAQKVFNARKKLFAILLMAFPQPRAPCSAQAPLTVPLSSACFATPGRLS